MSYQFCTKHMFYNALTHMIMVKIAILIQVKFNVKIAMQV